MAVSRPEPGPFTKTATLCRPCSMAALAAASAGDDVALGIGDGNDRVVERALDVGLTHSDVLTLGAADARGASVLLLRHVLYPLSYFFLPPI